MESFVSLVIILLGIYILKKTIKAQLHKWEQSLIESSFLSMFALISFFIFLLVNKYSHKIKNGALLDKDFFKPQAFHELPVTRSGGVACLISMNIFYVIYYLLYSKILFDYIFISASMFLIGFLDDLKINIKPSKRLFL